MRYFIKHISRSIYFIRLIVGYGIIQELLKNSPLYRKLSYIFVFIAPLRYMRNKNLTFGVRLRKCFEELGPVYIKFGQVLSTREDIVGENVARDLRALQDKLPPFPFSEVKKIIRLELGRDISELFSSFDDSPVAAASISQVHAAITKAGDKVAVKILRPQIHKKYSQDIGFLLFLIKVAYFLFSKLKRLKLHKMLEVIQNTMKFELDLRFEAAASSEIRDKYAKDNNLYIPKIFWDLSSAEILTSEWLDGISIYEKDKLIAAGFEPMNIATKIATIFFSQVFRDGYFHADLHPGNVFVLKDGRIAFIDFGIMGALSDKDRIAMAEILYGFLKKDYIKVARVHINVGYLPKDTDIRTFAQACRSVGEPIIGLPTNQISVGTLLKNLFKIAEDFNMQIQPQLLLLQKTMVTVEGIGQELNPNVNMWMLAEKWIKKWAARNITPEAKLLKFLQSQISEVIEKWY